MQLKRHEQVATAVTAMTLALLGSGGSARAAGKIESSLLLYSETDRIKAAENVTEYSRDLTERRRFSVRLTLDGLTGASPNGATPSSHIQAFTGASGKVGFTAQPGRTPLDNTFHDQRLGVDGSLIQTLDRVTTATVGGHFSAEQDYVSLGLHSGISRDFNRKNTTLSLSAALSHDIVSPVGGAPTAYTSMPAPSASSSEGGEGGEGGEGVPGKGKNIIDAIFGVTQVLDRSTLLRLDYSISRSSGYLNDPYKLLSVVQDWGSDAPGEPVDYLYEKRPSVRSKQAVFGELRRDLFGATLGMSYRYFWDDWGVVSRTYEVAPRIPLPGGHAIEPHVRWYKQTAALFYHPYVVEGHPLPGYASADSRLAAFDATTWGLKYSFPVTSTDRLSIATDFYSQHGSRGPPDAVGVLSQYDLFPKMNVVMVRLGYSHDL